MHGGHSFSYQRLILLIAFSLSAGRPDAHSTLLRDLDELDVVGRIMRKDNYLISMINKGVISPRLPLPRWMGLGRSRALLTKTLEWNLRQCLLDWMIDERTFRIRRDFLEDPSKLQSRERITPPESS
jgi:hypothetical protein